MWTLGSLYNNRWLLDLLRKIRKDFMFWITNVNVSNWALADNWYILVLDFNLTSLNNLYWLAHYDILDWSLRLLQLRGSRYCYDIWRAAWLDLLSWDRKISIWVMNWTTKLYIGNVFCGVSRVIYILFDNFSLSISLF